MVSVEEPTAKGGLVADTGGIESSEQTTDGPRCPRCATEVQPSWDWCHACGYDPDGLRPATALPPPGAPSDGPVPSYPSPAVGEPLPAYGLPAPPPGPAKRTGVALTIGAIAIVMVLVVGVTAVLLLGKTSNPSVATTDRSGLASPGTTAPRATRPQGPCGVVPSVTALPGPSDSDLMVSPGYVESLDVSGLERFFGPMTPTGDGIATYFAKSTDVMRVLRTSDAEARQAELDRDGFRGAAWRTWSSQGGDYISVFLQAFGDPTAAEHYADHHLTQDCVDSSPMRGSTVVPGAVAYMNRNPKGNPQVQLIGVVGDTEVNVTICACRPADESLATAEAWLRNLTQSLPSGTAGLGTA